jgi:hypothetical protein
MDRTAYISSGRGVYYAGAYMMDREDIIYCCKLAVTFMIVIALGIASVYYFVGYINGMKDLRDPCDICLEKNPILQQCYSNIYNKDTIYLNASTLNLSFVSR